MAYITKRSKKPEMLGDVGFKLDKKPEYIKKKKNKIIDNVSTITRPVIY